MAALVLDIVPAFFLEAVWAGQKRYFSVTHMLFLSQFSKSVKSVLLREFHGEAAGVTDQDGDIILAVDGGDSFFDVIGVVRIAFGATSVLHVFKVFRVLILGHGYSPWLPV